MINRWILVLALALGGGVSRTTKRSNLERSVRAAASTGR